jgi:hypothetical protein
LSGIELGASEFLGRRAAQVVYAIPEPQVRDRVIRAILVCDDGLEVVDALDLSAQEVSPPRPDALPLATWNALAPDVRTLLLAVRRAGDELLALFPAPPDVEVHDTASVDLDFDVAFQDLEQGSLPSLIRDQREHEIDAIVGRMNPDHTAEEVGRAISTLASMLQSDFVAFGQRLQNPRVVGDHWFLLAELQEMRSKCAQCLEAVVATVLKAFTHEDLELVLPRYQSAARRAQRLRAAVVDLTLDVERLNEQAREGGLGDLQAIRHALIFRLKEFAEQPVYGHVRPLDKREFIRFRQALDAIVPGRDTRQAFLQAVEGFAKFLDVMRAINDRAVLTKSDRAQVETARMLLESEEEVAEAMPFLEQLYGRDRELDALLRELRQGRRVDQERLVAAVGALHDTLRGAGAGW